MALGAVVFEIGVSQSDGAGIVHRVVATRGGHEPEEGDDADENDQDGAGAAQGVGAFEVGQVDALGEGFGRA